MPSTEVISSYRLTDGTGGRQGRLIQKGEREAYSATATTFLAAGDGGAAFGAGGVTHCVW